MPCSAEAEQEEQTAWEKVQEGWKKAGNQLSEWGVLSPRLMLAGGGLFMTLSNWGLLPAVRSPLESRPCSVCPMRKSHEVTQLPDKAVSGARICRMRAWAGPKLRCWPTSC